MIKLHTSVGRYELHIENVFDSLKTRRLIISRQCCTGVDALYNLFSRLEIVPMTSHFPIKIMAFFSIFLKGNSFSVAKKVFSEWS